MISRNLTFLKAERDSSFTISNEVFEGPIRTRTQLVTPENKKQLSRSFANRQKGPVASPQNRQHPIVESKSRWMGAKVLWLADWLVQDMWPNVVTRPPQWACGMFIHVCKRTDFRSCFSAQFNEFSTKFNQFETGTTLGCNRWAFALFKM